MNIECEWKNHNHHRVPLIAHVPSECLCMRPLSTKNELLLLDILVAGRLDEILVANSGLSGDVSSGLIHTSAKKATQVNDSAFLFDRDIADETEPLN